MFLNVSSRYEIISTSADISEESIVNVALAERTAFQKSHENTVGQKALKVKEKLSLATGLGPSL